jgi:hypothetical protein
MKTFVAVLAAGLACGVAVASNDTLVSAGQLKKVPSSNLLSPTYQGRADQPIFDVVDQDGFVFTNTALPRQLLEDASVIPGPGSNGTFPLTVNAMGISFSTDGTVTDFDVEVTFWDGVNTTAPADSPVHINLLGGFIAQVRGIGAGAWITDPIDLTGLGTPISLPDAGTFVLVRYLQPDTTDLVAGGVQIVYDQSNDPNTFASNLVGASDINTWRDVDADGIIEAAEARSFAYPTRGTMVMTIIADVPAGGNPCPADFDGDGFVDFFDFDAFVGAFELGC